MCKCGHYCCFKIISYQNASIDQKRIWTKSSMVPPLLIWSVDFAFPKIHCKFIVHVILLTDQLEILHEDTRHIEESLILIIFYLFQFMPTQRLVTNTDLSFFMIFISVFGQKVPQLPIYSLDMYIYSESPSNFTSIKIVKFCLFPYCDALMVKKLMAQIARSHFNR